VCELFGLSSSAPVGMTYALHEFATHGGLIHRNKSGWGIAYRQGRDAILIKEPSPASCPCLMTNWLSLPKPLL
jgi:glutamine amidotransferase